MTQRLIITKGLPGSGKSTWAKEICANDKTFKRVNKDMIRGMLGGKHNRKQESLVENIRDQAVREALGAGYNVIVDDTNLSPKHETQLRFVAAQYGAEFEVNDSFLSVPFEVCVERDIHRSTTVGKDVIARMARDYLKAPAPAMNLSLPDAVICDLDGTLALFGKENPYNRDFSRDIPNLPVGGLLNLFRRHRPEVALLIVSGRDATFESVSLAWLDEVVGLKSQYELFMRPKGDKRDDRIVKREIYDQNIAGKYNVLFVLDDRPRVVRMWRQDLGLTVFQVAEDIEF